jgi:predicted ester cyclase
VATANEAFDDNLAWLGLVTALALVAAWVGGDLLVQRDSEANKTIVRRMYDAFTSGTVDQLDEVVDHDFVDHDPLPGQAPGLLGLRQAVGFFRAAFPDGRLEIDDLIAEGDKVVAHIRVTGTQVGAFRDIPPSAEAVTAEGVETFRINRGKIVEGWSSFGRLTPDENGVPTAPPPERVATGQSGHDDSA